MRASMRQIGRVSVLDLCGKITVGGGDAVLRRKVRGLLETGHHCILINLEKVSYMDSCGLGELIACYRRAKDKTSIVKLLSPSPKVYDLLELTKVGEVFETFRDEAEALASFSPGHQPIESSEP